MLSPEERQRIIEEEKVRQETAAAIRTAQQARARSRFAIGCLIAIIVPVVLFVGCALFMRITRGPGTTTSPPPTQEPEQPRLALLAYAATIGDYHITVEGMVENISPQPIQNLVAVAAFYDLKGNFVTSDDALIDFNPLLPNQRSSFKIILQTNPAAKRFHVQFRGLTGPQILHEDRSKPR